MLQWEEMDEANEDQKQKESAILKVEQYVLDSLTLSFSRQRLHI